jgi:thioredoxin reductase
MKKSDAIIIGAGPAGLACAASMVALGINATVLEKANAVGPVWRRHYDRLHLHTGFRPDLRQLLPDVDGVLSEQGKPLVTGQATNEPGLYFCGMVASPTGQLREIGLEARRIADLAKSYIGSTAHGMARAHP